MNEVTLLLIRAVNLFFSVLQWMILINVILSWVPTNPQGGVKRFFRTMTDPMLMPIRRLLQKSPLGGPGMMIDFSPLFAFLMLHVLNSIVIRLIPSIMGALTVVE